MCKFLPVNCLFFPLFYELLFLKQFWVHLKQILWHDQNFFNVFTTETFTYIFSIIFTHIFGKRQKSLTFNIYSVPRLNLISHYIWIRYGKFILSSITSGLEFFSVNDTSIYENFELNIFRNATFVGEICNNWQSNLSGRNIYKTLGILLITIVNNITMK